MGSGTNNVGTVKSAGLPNITGFFSGTLINYTSANGSFYVSNLSNSDRYAGGGNTSNGVSLDASRSSSIYGNSSTVQPPAICALICIKAL